MILVFGGTNEVANGRVRDWLMFHGFYYYPMDDFIGRIKVALGKEKGNVLVVERRGLNVWGMVEVEEGNWEERDRVYRAFGIGKGARVLD